MAVMSAVSLAERLHGQHHFGADRILYLASLAYPQVTLKEVKSIVQRCKECKSIDPSPDPYEKGRMSVDISWSR